MNIGELINKKKKQIAITFMLLLLAGLIGLAIYEYYAPINPSLEEMLKREIIGKEIVFDQNIIGRVEKRKDYGRSIELGYIDQKRVAYEKRYNQYLEDLKLYEDGLGPEPQPPVPDNFFSHCRLTSSYGMNAVERHAVGCP